ncbi:hypothetical protein SPRG_07341 [Saprolegnia parasitica CBS 223.65]|uniref:PH domain-containing protein n=1 Tax=Saprolegnia parasitica (strain CBS 223.65) TaxID=695850 RepID=A0A067CLQ4_SAPPC|nr:hypothetical protein SPRG_07341 [Saprolegnia parasitica CBS 223.65]KDO27712.1 hypothetical protein SPRG_07341 [Saprolegnia parasitica CBS 223.65]|eukprot:XP_012201521.1 hypothetical protein SPRG_07341 [Saprolegnia parasitica CBS 223.65]
MATISGSIEGYLIKLDDEFGAIVYCLLEEGSLVYYSGKGGALLGELQLTGNKVNVNLIRDASDAVPNRFIVSSRKRPEPRKELDETSFPPERDADTRLLFAASTPECQENWATAILNWNKHCWDDAETVFSYKDELDALRRLVQRYHLKEKPRKQSEPGSGHAVPVFPIG